MATLVSESTLPNLEVVDLCRVRPRELKSSWEREVRLWRDRLQWDVSNAVSALERAVDRGGLAGKAVRCGGVLAAYAYYVVEGDRAVISGFVVSPAYRGPQIGTSILRAVLDELDGRRVRRIETQFICFDSPWLVQCFEREGFRAYWRDFLRAPVAHPRATHPKTSPVVLLPWSAWNLSEMASLMERAHRGGVDADMNELYRSVDGCRVLLNNIVRQRGCGKSLAEACSIARDRSTDVAAGFAIVTEIARGHGHLAQVAVAPDYQQQGVGHLLIQNTLARLAESGMNSLSLMVSRGNERAHRLYRQMGFMPVYQFPVFSREL